MPAIAQALALRPLADQDPFDVVAEYEAVCDDLKIYAGLVDIATLSVVNMYLGRDMPAGDWLVVHLRPEYTSIVIMRGEHVIFFRNRPEGDEEPAENVHLVAHEDLPYDYVSLIRNRGPFVLAGPARPAAWVAQGPATGIVSRQHP